MEIERFVLNDERQETLNIYSKNMVLAHFVKHDLIQRLALLKDNKNTFFIEYDSFKNGLWAGLIVHPGYPVTDLHDFYLGKKRNSGYLYGVHVVRGNNHLEYYSQSEKGSVSQRPKNDVQIDWKKLEEAKSLEALDYPQGILVEQSTGTFSFAFRLIPGKYAPLAQVSNALDFRNSQTISIDTSHMLNHSIFDDIIGQAKCLLDEETRSVGSARDFCECIEAEFHPYFPNNPVI